MPTAPPITPEELRELCELEKKATPGEWFWNSYSGVYTNDARLMALEEALPDDATRRQDLEVQTRVCSVSPDHGDTAIGRQAADAHFIAELRTKFPRLMAYVQSLEARRLCECPGAAHAVETGTKMQHEPGCPYHTIQILEQQRDALHNALDEAVGFETATLVHQHGLDRPLCAPDGRTPRWLVDALIALGRETPGLASTDKTLKGQA